MDYTQQVTEALNGLGATSAEIAQTLENKGIRAQKGCPEACAISVYLTEQFPEVRLFETGGFAIYVNGERTAATPQAVRDFIGQFDVGAYPNLVLS